LLKVTPGTQALLDLEDANPDVLRETVSASPVPLWRQVRMTISVALGAIDLGVNPVPSKKVSRTGALRNVVASLIPNGRDVLFARAKSPLAFLVSGDTIAGTGSAAKNWLIDHFSNALEQDVTVLQWVAGADRSSIGSSRRTYSLDSASTRAAARGRLGLRDPSDRVRSLVTEYIRLIDLPIAPAVVEEIIRSATYHERLRPHLDHAFARTLDRVQPQVVLMQSAAYGAWGSLIHLMKERGIYVAEPQHGWIGPSHAAYNYGAAMFAPELRGSAPDELLTFGTWWGEGLRFPGKLTPIGKPYLEDAVRSARPKADRNEVLVVSSTSDPREMSAFVTALRHELDPSLKVVFRPHPSERPVVAERYGDLIGLGGVEIDSRSDVYEALGASTAVVGIASTVLFEALAFGCDTFVRESPATAFYVGDRFPVMSKDEAGTTELARQIMNRKVGAPPDDLGDNSLWSSGATSRFRVWFEDAIQRQAAS